MEEEQKKPETEEELKDETPVEEADEKSEETVEILSMYRCNPAPWKGYGAILAGCILQITLGSYLTLGNMAPYMTSYIRERNGIYVNRHDILWVKACMLAGQGATLVIGGYLDRKYGSRWAAGIGCFVFTSGNILTYFSLASSVPVLCITYGIMVGIGIGLSFYASLSPAFRWFPKERGMVSAIVMAGFGVGAFVFSQLESVFINPDDLERPDLGTFDDETLLNNTRLSFLIFGCVYAVMQTIGIWLLASPPYDVPANEPKRQSIDRVSLTINQAFKTRALYLMMLIFIFNNTPASYVSAFYKEYGLTYGTITDGFSDRWLTFVGSGSAIANFCGKFLWGYACDRLSYRVCLSLISILICTFTGTLSSAVKGGPGLYGVWIWILSFISGSTYVVTAPYCLRAFGPVHAGTIYGVVASGIGVVGFQVSFVKELVYAEYGQVIMLWSMASFSLASAILTLFYKTPSQPSVETSGIDTTEPSSSAAPSVAATETIAPEETVAEHTTPDTAWLHKNP